MKKLPLSFYSLLAILCLSLSLAGCQSAPSEESTQQVPEVPFSQGPTSPPSVQGPGKAVPTEQPEAVTEKETIRYTLPTSDNPPRFRQ